jgi:hypothetical protein
MYSSNPCKIFLDFFLIIYIALSIASINTTMLMQTLGLWSVAHALLIPLSKGSKAQYYQLQSFTCVVHFCPCKIISLVCAKRL